MELPRFNTPLGGLLALLAFALLFSPIWAPLVYAYVQRMRMVRKQDAKDLERECSRHVSVKEDVLPVNPNEWSVEEVGLFLRRQGVPKVACGLLKVDTFLGGLLALIAFALLFSPLWGPLVYCYIQRMRVISRQLSLEEAHDESRLVKDPETMETLSRCTTATLPKNPNEWSVKQVGKFLVRKGIPESVCAMLRASGIGGKELLELTDERLEQDVKVASAGIRAAVVAEIQKLKEITYV
ncbi:hypothetical protein HDU98_008779 [Podochytrium sp. JEL0797]|nr:hypothetical protein HDU98_008779 [Podochytrium sp. JEL0797]